MNSSRDQLRTSRQQSAAGEEDHRRPAARPRSIRSSPIASLLCATEMTRARADMDAVAEVFKHDQESSLPHRSERSRCCSSELAGQEGLSASRARCAGRRSRRSARRGECARRDRRISRSQRSGSHPPLHAALHLELRDRSGPVSARFLHDEVQPARQRAGGAARGPGVGASLSAGVAVARRDGSDRARSKPRCSKSPAWMRSRCSRPPARTAS